MRKYEKGRKKRMCKVLKRCVQEPGKRNKKHVCLIGSIHNIV